MVITELLDLLKDARRNGPLEVDPQLLLSVINEPVKAREPVVFMAYLADTAGRIRGTAIKALRDWGNLKVVLVPSVAVEAGLDTGIECDVGLNDQEIVQPEQPEQPEQPKYHTYQVISEKPVWNAGKTWLRDELNRLLATETCDEVKVTGTVLREVLGDVNMAGHAWLNGNGFIMEYQHDHDLGTITKAED